MFLQYLLGFRELGHEVLFVDSLDEASSTDELGLSCPAERSVGWGYLKNVMTEYGLERDCALLHKGGSLGMSGSELRRRLDRSQVLLNFNGYLREEELLRRPELRVYVDIDPGFNQIWAEQGLFDGLAGHERFTTVGLSIGSGSSIPTCGRKWSPTLPPVLMSVWHDADTVRPCFTSVTTWRGPFAPLERDGIRLGLRVHEFRRLASLPQLCRAELELALDIDHADEPDADLLRSSGWKLVDPGKVAASPDDYQRYVATSMGELMVAKEIYVVTGSGWFSDRSACYLAAGRPVVAQDTGWSRHMPNGCGLIAFSGLEDAAAALNTVSEDFEKQRRAAREIAGDCLSSAIVLPRLLASIGVA
jgi:hypothetical protein